MAKKYLITFNYREGLASVNRSSRFVYLPHFTWDSRFKCWLSVFAAIGRQGATQGGVSPIISMMFAMKDDHSEDKESSVGYNFSACSNIEAITDTPN